MERGVGGRLASIYKRCRCTALMGRSGVLQAALLWLVCWGHIASLPAIRASEEPPLQSESSLPTRLVEQMQELLGKQPCSNHCVALMYRTHCT